MQLSLFKISKRKGGPRKKPDHNASKLLQAQVIRYVNKHHNAVAYRISYGVRVSKNGASFATGQTPGLPDVWAIVRGKALGIEIKIGKDRLSKVQQQRKQEFLQTGGLYWEVKDYTTFKSMFDDLYRCNE